LGNAELITYSAYIAATSTYLDMVGLLIKASIAEFLEIDTNIANVSMIKVANSGIYLPYALNSYENEDRITYDELREEVFILRRVKVSYIETPVLDKSTVFAESDDDYHANEYTRDDSMIIPTIPTIQTRQDKLARQVVDTYTIRFKIKLENYRREDSNIAAHMILSQNGKVTLNVVRTFLLGNNATAIFLFTTFIRNYLLAHAKFLPKDGEYHGNFVSRERNLLYSDITFFPEELVQ